MLPLPILSKIVGGFAQSGLQVVMEDAATDADRAKIQVEIETQSLGLMDYLLAKYVDAGFSKQDAKTMAMVSVCVCTASVMEVVGAETGEDE